MFEGLKTRDHFAVLGVTRNAGPAEVKIAYARLARRYHPDSLHNPALADLRDKVVAIFVRVGEVNRILDDPESRSAYELDLKREDYRRALAARTGRAPEVAGPVPEAPGAAVREEAPQADVLGQIRHAERFMAAEKYWDAVQVLEELVPAAEGSLRLRVRTLLGQAYLKNPKWRHDGEEMLLAVVREDPRYVDAYYALGAAWAAAGMRSRAVPILNKVLELKPDHAEAAAQLRRLASAP